MYLKYIFEHIYVTKNINDPIFCMMIRHYIMTYMSKIKYLILDLILLKYDFNNYNISSILLFYFFIFINLFDNCINTNRNLYLLMMHLNQVS